MVIVNDDNYIIIFVIFGRSFVHDITCVKWCMLYRVRDKIVYIKYFMS